MKYIWEHEDWPSFTYRKDEVETLLSSFEKEQSKADVLFSLLSPDAQKVIFADSLSREAFCSSEIEGIQLHWDSVFSSMAKRMGLESSSPKDKYAESVASIIFDAVSNPSPLTKERLFSWDTELTKSKITLDSYRTGFVGVFSGRILGEEEQVYEAPPHESVPEEMEKLLLWLEEDKTPSVIKSAVASFWFVTIHPFADGNGRISRALADYVLAKEGGPRFFSMAKAIEKRKTTYYGILQMLQTQDKSLDLTVWVKWYLELALSALEESQQEFRRVILLTQAMANSLMEDLNARQRDILYRLFSKRFYGKLTSEKYRKIEKCSSAQATRDLSSLEAQGFLEKSEERGRSTSYRLNQSITDKILNQ